MLMHGRRWQGLSQGVLSRSNRAVALSELCEQNFVVQLTDALRCFGLLLLTCKSRDLTTQLWIILYYSRLAKDNRKGKFKDSTCPVLVDCSVTAVLVEINVVGAWVTVDGSSVSYKLTATVVGEQVWCRFT